MLTQSQKIVAGFVIGTVSVLSITAGYLPSQVRQKEEDILETRRTLQQNHDLHTGSMWKQLDAKLKQGQIRTHDNKFKQEKDKISFEDDDEDDE
jgi:hypothetical protein